MWYIARNKTFNVINLKSGLQTYRLNNTKAFSQDFKELFYISKVKLAMRGSRSKAQQYGGERNL